MFFSGVAIQRQEITLYLAQVVGIHHQLKKKKEALYVEKLGIF